MMKKTKLWKCGMAAVVSFTLLSTGTLAYAQGMENNSKATRQTDQSQWVVRKNASPKKLT